MTDNPCFNCGQKGHVVKDCPRDLNEDLVNKRKQAYLEEKKKKKASPERPNNGDDGCGGGAGHGNGGTASGGGHGGRGSQSSTGRNPKWAPPKEGEDGLKFIWTQNLGKQPYKWNTETNRWDMIVSVPAANGSPNGSTTNNGGRINNAATTESASTTTEQMQAEITNLQKRIQALNEQL
jgi:hypothetical protein